MKRGTYKTIVLILQLNGILSTIAHAHIVIN